MAKERTPVSDEAAAELLFLSDRTCCVCRLRGKPVQIHHLDEHPSNHAMANLAVVCFDCHRDTQISGGFDRKLDAAQVRLYRDDWHRRVAARRDFDHGAPVPGRASSSAARQAGTWPAEPHKHEGPDVARDARLLALIRSLPGRRLAAYRAAQPKWDTGVTSEMVDGNTIVVRELEQILIGLAGFYPNAHFDGRRPDDFFSAAIRDAARWHGECLEPHGPGTGGTIVSVLTGAEVVSSVERMVSDMVRALTNFRDDFNFHSWQAEWQDQRRGV